MSEGTETPEDMVKVTVSLPQDTVAKLDAMAKHSLLMSRGRVIQSMVDEVIEVNITLQRVMAQVSPSSKITEQNSSQVILGFTVAVSDALRRLSKFKAS
jgi:metal-responsive CopG/Arc/MetJ family transcriptional regulator